MGATDGWLRQHSSGERLLGKVLSTYFREIKGDTLLTSAEEQSLARSIAAGDTDARARLIQANLKLVVKIARDYMGRGLSMEDLMRWRGQSGTRHQWTRGSRTA